MNSLTWQETFRKGVADSKSEGLSSSPLLYLDFVVSGRLLSEWLKVEQIDRVGVFEPGVDKKYLTHCIEEFLGRKKNAWQSDRISFYICPECGDPHCGVISAKIKQNEKYQFCWSDFAYEAPYSEPDFSDYKDIPPVFFDYELYLASFRDLAKMLELDISV